MNLTNVITYKRASVFLAIILLAFFHQTVAFAAQTSVPLSIDKMQTWTNADNVKCTPKDGGYQASIDTKAKGTGYYTAYLYENHIVDWSDYGALLVEIKNQNKTALRVNLTIKTKDGQSLAVKTGGYCGLDAESTGIYQPIYQANGAMELPASFSGVLYIPFDSLTQKQGSNKITTIDSWGLSFTVPEKVLQNIWFGKFGLIQNKQAMLLNQNLSQSIEGDYEVQIPVAGESKARYHILSEASSNAVLKLETKAPGVLLSEDGTLTLTTEAQEGKISLCAVGNGTIIHKEVHLVPSWIIGKTAPDGISIQIPTQDKCIRLCDTSGILHSNHFLKAVRIGAIVVALLGVLVYITCRRKSRQAA